MSGGPPSSRSYHSIAASRSATGIPANRTLMAKRTSLARYRRLRGQDLYEEGRRRQHLPLVRRPSAEDQCPHRGLRLDRRGQLGARSGPRPLQSRQTGQPALPHPLPAAGPLCRGRRARPPAPLPLQQALLAAGAEPAPAPGPADRLQDGISRITDGMVDALEVDIDRYMNQVDLPPHFVIPGGTELSAALDVARSAIRRAERRTVELRDSEGLASDAVLRYLNRASDLAFALARFADEKNPQIFQGREGA